jgi:transcriptional regulator with XRE-family HTH domain
MAKEWSKQVFSQNLRRLIADSGKTQKEIADIIGVSAPTFNEWVSGKKFPRIDKIQKLADYFGILKSDLIEEKEKPAIDDGLTDSQRKLIDWAKGLSEDQAAKYLQLMQTIVELDK